MLNDGSKVTRLQALRMVFPDVTPAEIKSLSPSDRDQLASAAARFSGVADNCEFVLVEY